MSIVPMLIDHCSPTLASLKCGSLFSIRPEDMAYTMREARALSDELAPKGLAIRVIDVGDGRALCYLYRPCQLCRMLACEKEAAFLTEQGYPYLTVEDAVDLLCARLSQGGAFPHEIGLFLAIRSTMSSRSSPTKGATACAAAAGNATPTHAPRRKRLINSASAPAFINACSPAEGRSISSQLPYNFA